MNLMFWKKKPHAEEGADSTQKTGDDKAVAMEPGQDAPEKPGLLMRVKSALASLNQRFKKTSATAEVASDNPEAAGGEQTVAMEAPDFDSPARLGLLTRVKSGFSGLVRRLGKSSASDMGDAEEIQSSEPQADDAPAIRSIRTKKRLIVGGAIGLLFLLLAGAGFAVWKFLLSSPEQDAAAPATAEIADGSLSEEQSEIEALRKKNDELQAQIEVLKKEPQQDQSPVPAEGGAEGEAVSFSGSGEITLSNKDPKAAAQSLKEAIEAMNASNGGPARRPEKTKPPAETGGE